MRINNYFKVLPLVLMMFTSCDKKEEEINLTPEIENQVFEVSESVSSGEKFADIVATDAEENKLVFKIKENEADLFQVSEEGALSIAATKSLDYETKTIHKITVEVSDGSTKASAEVTIKVTDVDETPVIANQQFTVVENVLATHIIGSVVATDPNNDSLTYNVTSTDFEITNSGDLSLIDGKTLDYETKNEYKITVQVSDGALTASAEITIKVTNENEAPVAANHLQFSVLEDISDLKIIADVNAYASDPDGDNLIYSIKENDAGLFRISERGGTLRLAVGKSLDYETKTVHKIKIEVSDGSLSALVEFTIKVIDVVEDTIVNIPDANFKNALLANTTLNTNRDSEIQVSEAENYEGRLLFGAKRISDLTGIEYFTKLTGLHVNNNQITNIDVSKNVNLKLLYVNNNPLSSLDVTKNVLLEHLRCSLTYLSSLDVTKNTKLKSLTSYSTRLSNIDLSQNTLLESIALHRNRLTSIDISQNTKLKQLYVSQNKFTTIDASNNPALFFINCRENENLVSVNIAHGNNSQINLFDAGGSPKLTCIQIDSAFTPDNTKWVKDSTASYSFTACP